MRSLLLACAVALAACSGEADAPTAVPKTPVPDSAPVAGPDTAQVPDTTLDRAEPAASPVPEPAAAATPPPAAVQPPPPPAATESGRRVEVTVDASGFAPAQIALPAGVPSRLVITRTSDGTCATSVQSPALGIEPTPLPLGEPVAFEVTPRAAGEFRIACGMDMVSAVIVAE